MKYSPVYFSWLTAGHGKTAMGTVDHVENPYRILAVYHACRRYGIPIKHVEVGSVKEALRYWRRIHSSSYVSYVLQHIWRCQDYCFIDPDTYVTKLTLASCTASFWIVKSAVEGIDTHEKIFCAVRPPGHHAGYDGIADAPTLGFCIFNNAALCVELLRKKKYKVAVLDIDQHHGNGTEDILLGKKNVIYVSLHVRGIYPGTGLRSRENCYNFPLDPGCSSEEYIENLDKAIAIIDNFDPDVIVVSFGSDAHKDDPLSATNIDYRVYRYITERLSPYRTIFILEGGYNLKVLASCLKILLRSRSKAH